MTQIVKIAFLAGMFSINTFAQQPLIDHIYAADPSAHVWESDTSTMYVYTSHDEPGTNHHITMFDYHVFSSQDLVNWVDHGRVLSCDDVDWAISHAWAIDAASWKGKYYLVFCMRPIDDSKKFHIGLAVSDFPQGPFKSLGEIKGVEDGMDPSIFIDDDNSPYLIWAHSRHGYIAELNEDLLSIKENTLTDISEGLYQLQEGPFLHENKQKYYLSYPGLRSDKWPEVMYYSMSDSPYGPYESKGQYIPWFEGQAGTNHGSIVEFKGNWYAFHHGAQLSSNNSYVRNLLADPLFYNEDGTIQTIIPDDDGITGGVPTVCDIKLEAENGKASGGKLMGVSIETEKQGYTGAGYVANFDQPEDFSQVLVQLAMDKEYILKVKYRADEEIKTAILINDFMVNGGYSDWEDIVLPPSINKFSLGKIGKIKLNKGDNTIRFMTVEKDILLDYFLLEPVE